MDKPLDDAADLVLSDKQTSPSGGAVAAAPANITPPHIIPPENPPPQNSRESLDMKYVASNSLVPASIATLSTIVGAAPNSGLSFEVDTNHQTSPLHHDPLIDGKPKTESGKEVGLFKAFQYAKPVDWVMIITAWVLELVNGVLAPLNFVVMGDAMGNMASPQMSTFETMMRNFLILGAVAFVCVIIATFLLELAAERQIRRCKQLFIESVLRQEVGYFDIKDVGTLAAEVEGAAVQIRTGIGSKSGMVTKTISTFFGSYAVGLWKNWRMTLVLTAVIPVLALSLAIMIRKIQKFASASRKQYERAGALAEEALPAFRTVAAYNMEQKFADKFALEIDKSLESDLHNAQVKAAGLGIIMCVIFCSYALGWWYGGARVVGTAVEDTGVAGLSKAGEVMTCFFAVMIGSLTLGMLSAPLSLLGTAAKAAADLGEIINRVSIINPEIEGGETRTELKGRVEFKNVRFCYPSRPDKSVYNNVSFVMEAGEKVALVGPSGCGKSTVIQLLERFYDQTDGQILVDDLNHKLFNLQWLRQHMSLVSQEPRLFCDTIYKNIEYGRKGATRDQVIDAAKEANAHNFIMQLPDGYETNVGQGGSLLSGGQKQRIAIARAMLRDPSILILDEATSALDNHSERIVQDALDKLLERRKRTTIIIAHRLTTIRGADKIIVMDNRDGHGSEVIECGTHEQLMKIDDGVYKQLVLAQSMTMEDASTPEGKQKREEIQKQLVASRLSAEMGHLSDPRTSRASSVSKMLDKYSDKGKNAAELETKALVTEIRGRAQEEKLPHFSKAREYMNKKEKAMNVAGICFAAIMGACQPMIVLIVARFLGVFYSYDASKTDAENASHIQHESGKYACYFLILAAINGIAGYFQDLCFGVVGERLVANIRKRVFANTIHQDAEFFDDPRYNTGFLSSVLSADCENMKNVTGQNVSTHVQTVFTCVVSLIIAFVADSRVAAVAIALYFVAVPSGIVQSKLTKPVVINPNSINDEASAAFVLNETVTNLKTIAAYGLQKDMQAMYYKALTENYKKGRRNCAITATAAALTECIMYFSSGLTFWYAGKRLTADQLTVENMMRSAMTIMVAGNRTAHIAEFTSDTKKAKAGLANILFLIERKPKMDVRDDTGGRTPIKGQIDLEHVKFRYPGRPTTPVLADVSFSGAAGKTIALVGESGSGKSTVVQFLERFYDVEPSDALRLLVREHNDAADPLGLERYPSSSDMFGGNVKLDGRNVASYNLQYLRNQLGHVGQEPVLFDMSVRENIRAGKPDATDDEIQAAAKAANAHDFISKLDEGYDTNVGKGGGKLSGGQKQRIAIARAIIRDPKVLLLDEATSALDPESEEIVQRALDELMKTSHRTTVVIAHRLSTIRNADKIVVFGPEPGVGSTIIESGTHEELVQIPHGVYRHLVELVSSK
eukprot:Blabericola_migrator_1__142@NODE_1037_length_5638_cov_10_655717_g714_i0_p1_GENE_NODE_1037_length_5638_cov_10_655717_g714_i0NODE_1037_length_5638_cov_10_655717_g714_i0_p1_ORF_typecomplete_len1412_score372_57ABC_membrane/PF00664_23/2_6e42ABC_membrane/PF00664_23/1_3e49ABC_tran/PF00005_27/2_9e40ABC_tran/PF00005_27/8_8e36AAA_21/PF13304_6/6_7e06AAA_21/PF13304_6/5e06SMC_N/PF02463_19/18SMC_N/PF02463_19/2_2e05SMC_N/PF02463_19/51SMC_N/PF02463_19/9_6e05TniB/PF05621_11/0_0034TniB/PF05621_11/0_21TniB/PF05621